MIIEIKYKDKVIWQGSEKEIEWGYYSKKYKKGRIQPWYTTPVVVTDVWNNKESDIQLEVHDAWYMQFNVKESEKKSITHIKSVSDIQIIQYNETSAGLIVDDSYIPDLTKSDLIDIQEEPNIGQTSGTTYTIIFKTNRTIVNKTDSYNLSNNIKFTKPTAAWELRFESDEIPGKIDGYNGRYIFSLNGQDLKRYRRIGDNWILANSGTITQTNTILGGDITALSDTSVAIVADQSSGFLVQYDIINEKFTQVGNALSGIIGAYNSVEIAALSSTQICLYGRNDAGVPFSFTELKTYDTNGTDWTQTGNTYTRNEATNADICKMTSSKIALANASTNTLSSFNFNGIDWTLDQDFSTTIGTNTSIARLSDNSVVVLSSFSNIINSYVLSGTWSFVDSLSLVLNSSSKIASVLASEVYISAATPGNYDYSESTYYSDYDVLDWIKDTEDVNVDWFDGTIKLAQTVSKKGFEYVQYIKTSDHDDFLELLKESTETKINGNIITEVEFEKALIAEDLYKIIIRGVETTSINTFDLTPNNDHSLSIDNGSGAVFYYSDYDPEFVSESPETTTVVNKTGVSTTVKSITKEVKQFRFFGTESETFALKKAFESKGTILLDSAPVKENRDVTPNKLGVDLWEVVCNCLLDTTSL